MPHCGIIDVHILNPNGATVNLAQTLDDLPQVYRIELDSFTLPWPFNSYVYELTKSHVSRCFVATTNDDKDRKKVLGMIVIYLIEQCNTWFWLIALMGFGRQYLNRTSPFLKYASEIAYPYYILHQTVVFIVGYYVVQWETAALLKYVVISLTSLAVTLLLYEFAVRRTRVTRWLFGMRPK